MSQTSLFDAPASTPPANPFADARTLTRCDRCGSPRYIDRRIHDGASLIRECAYCRRFLGFPIWQGTEAPAR